MKVSVVGTGYVGLVTGVALAHVGHMVTCLDINEEKINIMRKGISPIYEEGLEELMKANKERLIYTTDYDLAFKEADIVIIGVGTPERSDGSANLEYVYNVAEEIANRIEKDMIVVLKSTVPIGTNDQIEQYINERTSHRVMLVSNPEFLSQGTAVKDTLYAKRIVVGTEDPIAQQKMQELYEPFTKEPYHIPYLCMGRNSAEMVKYASNDFLALKISYINEISNFCEKIGADITDVTKGMGYDDRIGNKFLQSGIGYGGSCFPKDTKALHWLSKEAHSELKTIKACIDVNKEQKIALIRKIEESGIEIKDKKIAILGATFKPGTDDLRDAPSIDNIELLLERGAIIEVYDPVGLENLKKRFQDKVNYTTSIENCIKDADFVLIMTEWQEVKDFPIQSYVQCMKTPIIYDGRNCYELEEIEKYPVDYISMGRRKILNYKGNEA